MKGESSLLRRMSSVAIVVVIGIFAAACGPEVSARQRLCAGRIHDLNDSQLLALAREKYIRAIGRTRAQECRPYESVALFDERNPSCCRLRRVDERPASWELGVLPNDKPAEAIAVIGYRCLDPVTQVSVAYIAEISLMRCGVETATVEGRTAIPGWEHTDGRKY